MENLAFKVFWNKATMNKFRNIAAKKVQSLCQYVHTYMKFWCGMNKIKIADGIRSAIEIENG